VNPEKGRGDGVGTGTGWLLPKYRKKAGIGTNRFATLLVLLNFFF
jgi:hypothetical protein